MTVDWKALQPREHALWGWLGVPLVAALLVAPHPSTLLAGVASFAGFGAANALGRRLRGSEKATSAIGPALGLAVVAGALALWLSPHPIVLGATLGVGGLAGLGGMALLGGQVPRNQQDLEAFVVIALAALGGAVMEAGGAPLDRVVAASAAVAAWLVVGLWWVNRALAPHLKGRVPWPRGPAFAAIAVIGCLALGLWLGHPLVASLPLLYPVRVALQPRPRSARDAKRTGLTELAAGLAIAALAAVS
jgi:hypothetical protein